MKKEYRRVFHAYFKDFYIWNAIVLSLFLVAYLVCLLSEGVWGKYWVIPVLYVVSLLTGARHFILFFGALRDYKKKKVSHASIAVERIVPDKHNNYYQRGGAMVGREKAVLQADDGACYRLTACRQKKTVLTENYTGARVEAAYLTDAKIVLHMKPSPESEKNDLSAAAVKKLKKDFSLYFFNSK